MSASEEKVAVVGLGYVGLPLAVALAECGFDVVAYDESRCRMEELSHGKDRTGEVSEERLRLASVQFSADPQCLADRTFYIVAVPTPIDLHKNPDLGPVRSACATIGRRLRPGAVIVLESTVYPGVTEGICGPILEAESGLKQGEGFRLGYSPERVNPGDPDHKLETIVKVISAEDEPTLSRLEAVYGSIIRAGLHKAPSIRVAEAAKVIENTQRDLNIALMNELAMIFDQIGIRRSDVLAAARTKWNFLPFTPGLVGGHCIGVDPYYLTSLAEELGYHPQVILAGRRINDGMGRFVAQKLVQMLSQAGLPPKECRVGVLGMTFKEDVPDVRNSRVPDILSELEQFGVVALAHDPWAHPAEVRHEFGRDLSPFEACQDLHGLILAVPHRAFVELGAKGLGRLLAVGGVLLDVRSAIDPAELRSDIRYWSL